MREEAACDCHSGIWRIHQGADTMTRGVLLCGTPLAESETRFLQAGKLEAHFDAGALRWICWNGNEVLRAIMFLVRTPGWGTAAATLTDLTVNGSAGSLAGGSSAITIGIARAPSG